MKRKEDIQNSISVLVESYFEQKRSQVFSEFLLSLYKNLIDDPQFLQLVPDTLAQMRGSQQQNKCLKLVSPGEVSFVCEQCSYDPTSSLICKDCFDSTAHINHRVSYSTQHQGICDCGDTSALKICCPKHSPKQLSSQPSQEKQQPSNEKILILQNNFRAVIKNLLNILIERAHSSPFFMEYVSRGQQIQKETLDSFGINVLRFLHEGCAENSSLFNILCETLMSPVKNADPQFKISHACNKLNQRSERKSQAVISSKNCECTCLELILRQQNKFSDNFNASLLDLLEKLIKFSENFGIYSAGVFPKLFHFFFYEVTEGVQVSQSMSSSGKGGIKQRERMYFSKCLQIYCQFFTSTTGSEFLKSKYFENIYEQLRRVIINYFEGQSRLAFNAFNQIKNMLAFILSKDHLIALVDLKQFMAQIIACAFISQNHVSPEVSDEIEKMRLMIECGLLLLFKKAWSCIYEMFFKDKQQRIKYLELVEDIIIAETKKLSNTHLVAQKSQQNHKQPQQADAEIEEEWPIHFTGLRMLSIVLNLLIVETNISSVKENLLMRYFDGKEDKLETYIAEVIEYPLRAMDFARTTEQKVGNYFQMMCDPQKSMKIEIINSFYKKSFYGQMDLDISLIQVLLAVIKESNSRMPLMNIVSTIYGDIDIKQIYFSTQDETYKKRLGSVLELLAVLAVNNAAIVNTVACSCIFQNKIDPRRPAWLEHHLHCVIINAFHLQKVHDLKSARDVLFDKILNYDVRVESFIFDVAEPTAPSAKTLRLKKEYTRQYEPFLFHKYARLSSDLFEKVKELSSKHDDCDPIIGNISLYVGDSFLRTLLNNLFSDEVPRYLMLCFRIDALNETLNDVLKFSIKLVGLYLTFCIREIIELKAFDEARQVFDHLLRYFLKPELEKKLIEMKKNRKLQEIKQTIENIHRMIALLKEEINDISASKNTKKRFVDVPAAVENKEKQEKLKQQQSREEKMRKQQEMIKQEFMKKQAQFQLKNTRAFEFDTSSQGSLQSDHEIKVINQQGQQQKKRQLPPSAGLCQGDCGESIMSMEEEENHNNSNNNSENLEDEPSEVYSSISNEEEQGGESEEVLFKEYVQDGEHVCSYCHYPVNHGHYGLSAYISEDNLIYYSMNVEGYKQEEKQALLEGFSGFRIETCGHFVHAKCRDKMLKSNLAQVQQKKVLFSSPYEYLCMQCKGLSNLFVPVVLPKQIRIYTFSLLEKKIAKYDKTSLKQMDFSSFEKIVSSYEVKLEDNSRKRDSDDAKNKEQLEDLRKKKQILLETISDQFTQIMQLKMSVSSRNSNQRQGQQFHEDYIIEIGDKTVIQLSSVILLTGWNHYFEKCFRIAANFFASFREFLRLFDSPSKAATIEGIKQQIIKDILPTSPMVQETELTYLSKLWRCAMLEKRDNPIDFIKIYRLLTRRVFEAKIIAFFIEKRCEFTYQERLKSEIFQCEIVTYILPFMKASVATLLTIFQLQVKELSTLDEEKFDSDLEQYAVFQALLARISCEDIFDFSTVRFSQETLSLARINNVQMSPFKMVTLPQDLLKFRQAFCLIKGTCCNDYARFGDPYLCLICEKVTCSITCQKDNDSNENIKEYEETFYSYESDEHDDPISYKTFRKKSRIMGNLNRHACMYHAGKAAYLQLKNGQIVLFNYPKSIFYGWLYTDKFGHTPNPKNSKWEEFKLNNKLANKVQEILIQSKLPQEICYHLMLDSNTLIDRDYI